MGGGLRVVMCLRCVVNAVVLKASGTNLLAPLWSTWSFPSFPSSRWGTPLSGEVVLRWEGARYPLLVDRPPAKQETLANKGVPTHNSGTTG